MVLKFKRAAQPSPMLFCGIGYIYPLLLLESTMRNVIFFLFLLICLSGQWVQAQGPRFVYVENEQRKPFYVRFQDRLLSSSAEGYLVIPQLVSDTINLTIGFPKNTRPASTFQLSLQGKDVGLIIREVDSINWGLYDHRTRILLLPQTQWPVYKSEALPQTDRFSAVLAQVSNTPELNEKWVAVQQPTDSSKLPRTLDPPSKIQIRYHAILAAYFKAINRLPADSLRIVAISTPVIKVHDTLQIDSVKTLTAVSIITDSVTTKIDSTVLATKLSEIQTEKNHQAIDSVNVLIKATASDTTALLPTNSPSTDSVLIANLHTDQDSGVVRIDTAIHAIAEPISSAQAQMIQPDSIPKPVDSLSLVLHNDTHTNDIGKTSDSAMVLDKVDSLEPDVPINPVVLSSPGQDSASVLATDSIASPKDTGVHVSGQLENLTDTLVVHVVSWDSVGNKNDSLNHPTDTTSASGMPDLPVVKQESDTMLVQAAVNTALPLGCVQVATAEQVLQLKKKLRMQDNMRLMLLVAKDATEQACFSTSQITELAAVFLSEEMRFRFLEMAIDRLSDPHQKKDLLNCLTQAAFQKKLAERMQ